MLRLGLDLGTNSIGWCLFEKEEAGNSSFRFIDCGARIFSDGLNSDHKPNNLIRRQARGARRNRDRKNERISALANYFKSLDALTENRESSFVEINPYEARALCAEGEQPQELVVRALLHLCKRRGYKSNRKDASDKDDKKIAALKEQLGNKTLGQYLWQSYDEKRPSQKIRFVGEVESKFYPTREMYKSEFQLIKSSNAHAFLGEQWDQIEEHIFYQRPLKPQEKGKCRFFPKEDRIYKVDPLFQKYRLLQEVSNLRCASKRNYAGYHSLSSLQRETILQNLYTSNKPLSFTFLAKLKKGKERIFEEEVIFNLDELGRKKLQGCKTDVDLSKKERFGDLWSTFTDDEHSQIIDLLLTSDSDEDVIGVLRGHYGLTQDQAKSCAGVKLAAGTGSVSAKFIKMILPELEKGVPYHEAVKLLKDDQGCPLHHSNLETGNGLNELPYYGAVLEGSTLGANPSADPDKFPEQHYGKVSNVTVHVALNQVQAVVNGVMGKYGSLGEIVIEVTRELKKSQKQITESNKRQKANKEVNDRINKDLEALGINPSYDARLKYKLWEELDDGQGLRICVFSGQTISQSNLFDGSVEVEHILPLSRTLDDSYGNKTLAFKGANNKKGNRPPYDAFGQEKGGTYDWGDILRRSQALPPYKRTRFNEDAMKKFEKESGFIQRQLTDTAYISIAAKQYLGVVCDPNRIWVTPGMLTHDLRHHWGLNHILLEEEALKEASNSEVKKDRSDHRHHIIDAFVVGLTDRGVLQKVSTATARGEKEGKNKVIIPALEDLYPNLKIDFQDRLKTVLTSYKPDRSHGGAFFKETAYGLLKETDAPFKDDKPDYTLVTRKAVQGLSRKELYAVRDSFHRKKLTAEYEDARYKAFVHAGSKGKYEKYKLPDTPYKEFLEAYTKYNGVKKLRILVSKGNAVQIQSAPYKAYMTDSFSFCDIWEVVTVKGKKEYIGHFVSPVDAIKVQGSKEQRGSANARLAVVFKAGLDREKYITATAKKCMRLYKDDTVSLEEEGQRIYCKVFGFSATNNKLDIRFLNKPALKQQFIIIPKLISQKLKLEKVTPLGEIIGG